MNAITLWLLYFGSLGTLYITAAIAGVLFVARKLENEEE